MSEAIAALRKDVRRLQDDRGRGLAEAARVRAVSTRAYHARSSTRRPHVRRAARPSGPCVGAVMATRPRHLIGCLGHDLNVAPAPNFCWSLPRTDGA